MRPPSFIKDISDLHFLPLSQTTEPKQIQMKLGYEKKKCKYTIAAAFGISPSAPNSALESQLSQHFQTNIQANEFAGPNAIEDFFSSS